MARNHDTAVKKLAYRFRSESTTTKVYADGIDRFDDPPHRVGDQRFTPDIVVEYSNGREKFVEVDSGSRPLSGHAKRQNAAFERSAAHKPNRTYEHVLISEV